MKFDRFLDKIAENWEDDARYHRLSADYKRKHGHGAFFDLRAGLSDEKQPLFYASQDETHSWYVVSAMAELLDLDSDQMIRSYIAARALLRWYKRTEWQFCPSQDLIDRLEKFVMG